MSIFALPFLAVFCANHIYLLILTIIDNNNNNTRAYSYPLNNLTRCIWLKTPCNRNEYCYRLHCTFRWLCRTIGTRNETRHRCSTIRPIYNNRSLNPIGEFLINNNNTPCTKQHTSIVFRINRLIFQTCSYWRSRSLFRPPRVRIRFVICVWLSTRYRCYRQSPTLV